MAKFIGFAGQNWLITPATPIPYEGPQRPVLIEAQRQPARAVVEGETVIGGTAPDPTLISQLQWLMVLSGIAIFTPDDPTAPFEDAASDVATIFPDVVSPMTYAINQTGLAIPQGQSPVFSVEQMAPFCTSVMDNTVALPGGGFVRVWRPTPYQTGTTLPQIFTGVNAEVEIVDWKGNTNLRISYNIALLGRIFYLPAQ